MMKGADLWQSVFFALVVTPRSFLIDSVVTENTLGVQVFATRVTVRGRSARKHYQRTRLLRGAFPGRVLPLVHIQIFNSAYHAV